MFTLVMALALGTTLAGAVLPQALGGRPQRATEAELSGRGRRGRRQTAARIPPGVDPDPSAPPTPGGAAPPTPGGAVAPSPDLRWYQRLRSALELVALVVVVGVLLAAVLGVTATFIGLALRAAVE